MTAAPWATHVRDGALQRVRCAHPAFARMAAIALEKGWPKRFASDLYHRDREALERSPHDRGFVWALEEKCTVLVFARPRFDAKGRKNVEASVVVDAILEMGEEVFLFAWDGASLRAVSREEAIEALIT